MARCNPYGYATDSGPKHLMGGHYGKTKAPACESCRQAHAALNRAKRSRSRSVASD